MRIGLGLSISLGQRYGSGAAAFDPATLSLSGWWRADFADPWTPTASAGTSGGNGDLVGGGLPPTSGTTVNGHAPADYDGANDRMETAAQGDDLWTLTDGTTVALINADALAADAGAGAPYANAAIVTLSGAGFCMMGVSADGLRCAVNNGGYVEPTAVPFSTGSWVMAVMRWGSGTLGQSINLGTEETVGVAGPGALDTYTVLTGCNFNAGVFFDGKVLEIMTAPTRLSDANLLSIKSYFNSRYGLAL